MGPHTSIDQELPTSYNGFSYLITGSVQVGGAVLNKGAGRMARSAQRRGHEHSARRQRRDGARLVPYAGQPQGDRIVSNGPFIGDSKEDIVRLYTEYRAGKFVRTSELARQEG